MPEPSATFPGAQTGRAETAWQDGLIAQLDAIGPTLGRRLLRTPPASAEVISAERFHDIEYLRLAINRCGESLFGRMIGESEPEANWRPAVAASRFTRHYLGSMTVSALVALAHGVGLDMSAERCLKLVEQGLPRRQLVGESDEGVVTCRERPPSWAVQGASMATLTDLRGYVWRQLYAAHLAPLFAATTALTGAAPKVLWSNAAESVAYTADTAAVGLPPDAAAPIVAECEALLHATKLPGVAGPNPLTGLIGWTRIDAADFPRGIQLRRHCCLTYQLPAREGLLCFNCPFLPLDERIAVAREMQGAGATRGGPAVRRSIEIGKTKLRKHR